MSWWAGAAQLRRLCLLFGLSASVCGVPSSCLSKGVLPVTRKARTGKTTRTAGSARAKQAQGTSARQRSERAAEERTQKTSSTTAAGTAEEHRPLLKSEQLGATLAKGLDLAEASLSLGLTLMTRLGSIVQESVLDKVGEHFPGPASSVQSSGEPDKHAAAAPTSSQSPAVASGGPPGGDSAYCITNRLPLFPGQPVSVSFSINNDSEEVAKRVKLRVEGFVGQISAVTFSGETFSVKPGSGAIAPMDFEKFMIKGALPSDIPSDVYLGKVVVTADHNLEIPVRLVVGPPTP